jgi:hypothetical protein
MAEHKQKIVGNIIIALILAMAMIISCYLGVYGLAQYKAKKNSIDIKGSATQQITSDLIVWTGAFTVQADDLKKGYSRLGEDKDKVIKYLTGKGLSEETLVFSSITTNKIYGQNEYGSYTNEVTGYNLTQMVTISSNEIDKITEISRDATELLNEDVQFQSYAPEYIYTKLADLKVSLLADATKDATIRAQMIAENSGSKLGKLKKAKVSSVQITPLYTSKINYYDDYYYYIDRDTASLEKEVTVVVSCSFEID